MTHFVLDASAVLAVLQDENGKDDTLPLLQGADMSLVNVVEVAARLIDRGASIVEAERWVPAFEIQTHPFDAADARACSVLRKATSSAGLSLGDRACLALGQRLQKPVLTGDRAWKEAFLSQPIEFIR